VYTVREKIECFVKWQNRMQSKRVTSNFPATTLKITIPNEWMNSSQCLSFYPQSLSPPTNQNFHNEKDEWMIYERENEPNANKAIQPITKSTSPSEQKRKEQLVTKIGFRLVPPADCFKPYCYNLEVNIINVQCGWYLTETRHWTLLKLNVYPI